MHCAYVVKTTDRGAASQAVPVFLGAPRRVVVLVGTTLYRIVPDTAATWRSTNVTLLSGRVMIGLL